MFKPSVIHPYKHLYHNISECNLQCRVSCVSLTSTVIHPFLFAFQAADIFCCFHTVNSFTNVYLQDERANHFHFFQQVFSTKIHRGWLQNINTPRLSLCISFLIRVSWHGSKRSSTDFLLLKHIKVICLKLIVFKETEHLQCDDLIVVTTKKLSPCHYVYLYL